MNPIHISLVIAALLTVEPALAMRCGTKLIMQGDHQLKVEKLCGEPTSVQVRSIYRSGLPKSRYRGSRHHNDQSHIDNELLVHQRSLVEVVVEDWIYNFGSTRLIKQVRFENGVVVSIANRGRGYID